MGIKPGRALRDYLAGDLTADQMVGHVSDHLGGITGLDIGSGQERTTFQVYGNSGNTSLRLSKLDAGDSGRYQTAVDELGTAFMTQKQ